MKLLNSNDHVEYKLLYCCLVSLIDLCGTECYLLLNYFDLGNICGLKLSVVVTY